MPTIDRTFTGTSAAVRRDAAGRRSSPSVSSHSPWSSIASRIAAKCSRNFMTRSSAGRWPLRLQDHRDRRPWRARRTPSSRWRRTAPACRPPAGASGRSGRCCPGRGSRPRTGCSRSASSRLTHQVKLTSSLSKTRLRKSMSRPPSMANTSSAAHACTGRVDVAEVPLVGGQRAVRVLEPFPAQQDQLVLGERRVDVGQRHAVERQVPGGEPGVLPLVGHRHDVEGVEVAPPGVAARVAGRPAGAAGSGSPSSQRATS